MRLFSSPCQFTEADEDDWDISSVEDFLLTKDKAQKPLTVHKNESNAPAVVQAWGLPKRNAPKEEGNIHTAMYEP